jgi:GMP synthase-like glutamine amidotransferase
MIATLFGGSVVAATTPHLGDSKYADYSFHESTLLGSGNRDRTYFVAKHFDVVDTIPPGFRSVGSIVSTGHEHVTALEHRTLPIFGVQFHLSPTPQGQDLLRRFLRRGNSRYDRGTTTSSMLQCPKHFSK